MRYGSTITGQTSHPTSTEAEAGCAAYRIKPLDEATSVVVADYYFSEETPPDKRERLIETGRILQREDFGLVERQQEGVVSGAFVQGRLGPNEHAVHHFHRMVEEALDRD